MHASLPSDILAWLQDVLADVVGHSQDVFINVVASAVWATIGVVFTLIGLAWRVGVRRRRAGRLWARFMRGTTVVLGGHSDAMFKPYEYLGMTGLGDVRAAARMTQNSSRSGRHVTRRLWKAT
jgi:hypothetical protein